MHRRTFLVAVGATVTLAGCDVDLPDDEVVEQNAGAIGTTAIGGHSPVD